MGWSDKHLSRVWICFEGYSGADFKMERCYLGIALKWQQVLHNFGWKDEGIR